MHHKNLIILDIDGTLLQTASVTVPAVQRVFAGYGLPIPCHEAICSFFGQPVSSYEAWLAQQCPAGKAKEIVEATNALELRLIGEEGRLYPGVHEVLELLRHRGDVLAICSNGPQAYVDEFLDAHGLRDFFTVVFARGTQYSGKEEMVGKILAQLQPHAFLVVGDRQDDIEAAHAWGGAAIAARYGFGSEAEWRHADAMMDAITRLPELSAQLLASLPQ